MKKNSSLTLKLSISISSIVLAIFLVIIFINYHISRKLLIEDARRDAQNISRLTVSQIEDALNTVELPANYLANYLSKTKINANEFAKMLHLLSTNNDRIISSFSAYYKNEQQKEHDRLTTHYYVNGIDESGLIEKNEAKILEWQKELQIRNEGFWTEPYLESQTGELTTAYLAPAFIQHNDSVPIRGFIGIELRLQWLKELIESNKIYDFDYIFILSREGKPVVRPNASYNAEADIYAEAKRLNNPEIINLAEQMMAGKSGSIEMDGIFKQMESILYYTPVPSTHWSLAVVFPKKDLLAKLYETTLMLALTGIVGFVLILLAIILISHRITRPLKELAFSAREIGQGKFKVELPKVSGSDEVTILAESLEIMQRELEVYIKNLISTEKFKERIDKELQVAAEIQMGYLRKDFDSFSKDQAFKISAAIRPARKIGGDFYDYFLIDDHHLCFAIGDVAGKGVPAALFMTIVLTLTRAGNYTSESINHVVEKMNMVLFEHNENAMFTTFFLGILNTQSGSLHFCNAGHNYPYLLQGKDLFEVKATHGPAIGVLGGQSYKSGVMKLNSGDKLFLYTDGVTDAEDNEGAFFGKVRLEKVLTDSLESKLGQTTAKVMSALRKHAGNSSQSDDITLLALEFGSHKTDDEKAIEKPKN
jgi:sigma-B regulation protein RsbU (phosphoserine phosphatase)